MAQGPPRPACEAVRVRDAPNAGTGRFAGPLAALLLVSACGSALDRPPPTTGGSTPPTSASVTVAPVTPDGFTTGPGVTDATITLGLIVDPVRDRGFSTGVVLWQQAVNTSGGLCGRTVQLAVNGAAGVPTDAVEAYDAIGRNTLGLITLPAAGDSADLSARISADQLPTLTPAGSSSQLGPTRPIVVGAPADILAINGLDHLEQTGRLTEGATIGVLTDGSADANNALAGARWWAQQRGFALDVRDDPAGTVDASRGDELDDWGDATAVLALTDPAATGQLAGRSAPEITVLTTIDGYDPTEWDTAALAAAGAGRVLISAATPAVGSDYPAAVAVSSRLDAAGQANSGPRLYDGYATGTTWARLLTEACDNRALTRQAAVQAAGTVGAASDDSLFGPTDPGLPVLSALPATRVSAMSVADPGAPSGVRPLTWPQAAADIEEYLH